MNKLKDEEEILKIGVFLFGCIISKPSVALLPLALVVSRAAASLTSLPSSSATSDGGR